MSRISFLLPLAAISVMAVEVSPVQAGEVEKAEHIRLTEEMRRLSKRNAWKGVETAYVQLVELSKRGEVLSSEDHYMGAQAARALGSINDVDVRLRAAARIKGSPEIIEWLADLDTNYGRVELVNKRKEPVLLEALQMPFAPDKRTTIETAANQVTNTKGYTGLLPIGDYHFADKTFTVSPSIPVKIMLMEDKSQKQATRKSDEPYRLAYVGPRFTIGPSVTQVGDPGSAQGDALADSGPAGFMTTGGRVGLGLEIGFTERWGLLTEIGWTGGLGATLTDDQSTTTTGIPADRGLPFDIGRSSTSMGYGWLAGTMRAGKFWMSLGPAWYGGRARSYVDPEDSAAAEGSDHPSILTLKGDILAGGAAAGLSFVLMEFGNFNGALSLYGGAHTDLTRLYTWEELAFTLATSGTRRK